VVEEKTDDQTGDDGCREHPPETREVSPPEHRVGVSIGHPLRSLSQDWLSAGTRVSVHAPRGTGNARKISQRDAPTNRVGATHTTAWEGVGKRSVVMSRRPFLWRR
jgi:hypothetical protein